MRADTSDVAFRLLLALGEIWEGLERANIDPTCRGLHLTQEPLGGYTRYSAGPSSTPRLIVEWNESSRHLRVIRCNDARIQCLQSTRDPDDVLCTTAPRHK